MARGRRRRRGAHRSLWIRVGAAAALLAVGAVLVVSRHGGRARQPTAAPSTGAVTGADFHSLAADPTAPGRLYAGGHQSVSVSGDGGRTWSRVDALANADAMGWSFVEQTVYVSGHPGIRRSADGGATFRQANDGLPSTDVHAFGASPTTLYAAGPGNGVVASVDGGRTWTARARDAGQSLFGRILVDPTDDQRLVAADAQAGATTSSDGGRTWRPVGGPPAVSWVSRSGEMLYVSGAQAAKSTDGGASWTDLRLPSGATLVEADPRDPRVVYTGVHDGDAVTVWISRDGGGSWSRP